MQFCLEESLNGILKIQFHTHTVFLTEHACVSHNHPSFISVLAVSTYTRCNYYLWALIIF